MAKPKTHTPKWQHSVVIWLAITVSFLVVTLAALFIYANNKLGNPTKQTIVSHDASLKLEYEITREPRNPLVGQEVIFTVKVTNGSKPFANAKFIIDIQAREGAGINITGIPLVKSEELTTNANGTFETRYTPTFAYPLPDPNTFNVRATEETVAARSAELGYDPSKIYAGADTMKFTVYPRWLSLFKLR
jgi:hypothetical protein